MSVEMVRIGEHGGVAPIAVDGLDYRIDDTRILAEISLELHPGETLAIIGPSGTGKTTLLRLLALFSQPTKGSVLVEGRDIWNGPEHDRLDARRHIGMVFQTPDLFDATVRRNVEYGLHIRRGWAERLRAWPSRLVGSETHEKVSDALDVVGLSSHADQHAASVSGGEAQRTAFARALAIDPDVLLLDEPTSDLDPRNTAAIESAVETACDRGVAVAIATHDMHQANRIADRVAVMIDGRIVEVGPSRQIFEEPTDDRVRRFITGDLVY